MALLDDLISKKNEYVNLRDKVNDILSSLNNSVSSLRGPSSNIGTYYAVNGQSADKNTIRNNRSNLLIKRDYITNTVIPAINDKISGIESEIRQEEERIRKEQEKKKQEENEEK